MQRQMGDERKTRRVNTNQAGERMLPHQIRSLGTITFEMERQVHGRKLNAELHPSCQQIRSNI
jgi:hypothetical protein